MWLSLLRFFYRETPDLKTVILLASATSAISRGILLATINAAVVSIGTGRPEPVYIVAFAAFLGLFLGATYLAMSRARMAVEAMIQRLRLRICDKLLFTELDFVESRGTGALYARLTQDVTRLSESAITLINTLQAAVLVVFCLIYIGWLTLAGLLVTLATIAVGVTAYYSQERSAQRNLREMRKKEAEFFDSLNDLLKGFKELKINRAKHSHLGAWIADISETYRDLGVRTEIMFIKSFLTTETCSFTLIAVLVFVLPFTIQAEATTIFQFLATILFLIGPLGSVVTSIPSIARAGVALEHVQALEDSLNEAIAENENRAPRVTPMIFDSLRLDSLYFRFTGNQSDDHFDLGPIDLDIRRGEVLFITGGNGSGKTTLLKLVTGLYKPVSGRILVDGTVIDDHAYQSYREIFTTIFSDHHLFHRLFGFEKVDLNDLERLLTLLGLDAKTHYADGRFTTIDLSAGQRKRLAYAICHLEDRQVYVFDEFAAEQDPSFRRFFYETLLPDLKASGKTVIAVTHDDRYFSACDRLVKLDYGRLVPATINP